VTEWLRDALPGEVPAGYDTMVEQRGRLDEVPSTAKRVALGLFGLLFSSPSDGSAVALTLDDFGNCRFAVASHSGTISRIREKHSVVDMRSIGKLAAT
jgi:hypothetical protein